MKIAKLKPRNPLVALALKRKAGSHRKTNKQLRKQLNKLTREPFNNTLEMFSVLLKGSSHGTITQW